MKLLILSDSHGRADNLEAALARHRDASAVLFLGDGIRDLPCTSAPPIYAVRGNCDVYARFDTTPLPDERLECFAGRRLLALHGHTRAAKSGIVRLVDAAMEQDADILCFGHTHAPLAQYIPAGEIFRGQPLPRPLYLFNPGALNAGSFGLILLRSNGVLLSHGCL